MLNSTTGQLTGSGNTAIGHSAGFAISTGSNNITIGGGDLVITGSDNTLVGVGASASGSLSNATAIGNGAVAVANTILIPCNGVIQSRSRYNIHITISVHIGCKNGV